MPKMLPFFLPHSVLKWLHKNSPVLISLFFMHTDMTVVTTRSKKKIISHEVKSNSALLEPSYGKKQMKLLAKPTL